MMRIARWVWLPLLLVATGCAGDAAVAPLEPELSDARAGDEVERCFSPEFSVLVTPVGPGTFLGEVSGELEGTVVMEFDLPGSLRFAGATIHNSGTADWTITAGVVPDLTSFQTQFRNMNINVDRPGSPAGTFENVGSHRATAGVRRAELTYRGTFVTAPSPEALHHYHGVICT